MKMSSLRSQVLASFRNLHNARKSVFKGHSEALVAGRLKINEEFKKNKEETDQGNIDKLIKVANETAEYLRTSVVQTVYNSKKDAYEVQFTKDTFMIENVPFNENYKPERRSRRRPRSQSSDKAEKS